jgi:hypothetical protein
VSTPVRPVVGDPTVNQRTSAPEGPVGAGARKVALGSTRLPKSPSDVAETKEEQHMRLEDLGFG